MRRTAARSSIRRRRSAPRRRAPRQPHHRLRRRCPRSRADTTGPDRTAPRHPVSHLSPRPHPTGLRPQPRKSASPPGVERGTRSPRCPRHLGDRINITRPMTRIMDRIVGGTQRRNETRGSDPGISERVSLQLGPRRVVAPDGVEWRVRRRWLTRSPKLPRPRRGEIAAESLNHLGELAGLRERRPRTRAAGSGPGRGLPRDSHPGPVLRDRADHPWGVACHRGDRAYRPSAALAGRGRLDRFAQLGTSPRMARAGMAKVQQAHRPGRLGSISRTRARMSDGRSALLSPFRRCPVVDDWPYLVVRAGAKNSVRSWFTRSAAS